MRIRSLFAVAVAATALAGSLSACGSSGSGSGGGKSLTWYVNRTTTLTPAVYDSVVKGFVKTHPGVKIKVINQGGQSIGTYFQTLLSSGNAPDVGTGLFPSPQNITQFVDLSNQPWAKQLAESNPLAKVQMINGGIYTIPVGYQVSSIAFYNKDLFAKAGITSTPTTFAQLTADLAKLKALPGVTPVATAGAWVIGAQISGLVWPSLLQQNSDPDWQQLRIDGKTTFANSPWNTVLNTYSSWIKSGYVRKDALGLAYETVNNDFLQGKYGIYEIGSFFTGNIAATPPKFNVGVFAMPTVTGDTPAPLLTNGAFQWLIPKAAKHKQLATEFVKYLDTDPNAAKILLQADGDFDDTVSYPMAPVGQAVENLAKATKIKGASGGGADVAPNGYAEQFSNGVQSLFIGKSADKVTSDLDTWWDKQPKTSR